MSEKTKEEQYNVCLDLAETEGFSRFGLMANYGWKEDPKRLAFTFSRYKFVSKMFAGFENVLEVGCADGFASRIVRQQVGNMTAIDFDPVFIDDARSSNSDAWKIEFSEHDMLKGAVPGSYDGVFAMDVLEHITPESEGLFLGNMFESLKASGAAILGIPSLESQQHASAISRAGHVNCKSAPKLRSTLLKHFHSVFIFSMNDEVVHTGYYPMAQYLFALCANKK